LTGATVTETPIASTFGLEQPSAAVKPRMALIVNPRATTVSARLKKLVAYALRGRYDVEALETEGPNHATALARAAADEGFDVVVAFGGDGTVNEVANGLAGFTAPLAILPGGCTNVVCRMLGVPNDVIDATEHLLGLADGLKPRPIDLGKVNGRWFVSSAGVGLDADTTRWVDEQAHLKRRAGPFFFSYAGAVTFARYLRRPARITVETQGRRVEGVSAVLQNSDPYTFFKRRPVRLNAGQALDSGTLSMVVLRDALTRDVPTLAWRLLSGRPVIGHPRAESFPDVTDVYVSARGGERPLSVQVDGDYIGDLEGASFSVHPGALRVVA
jgi:diacylglycerol kinase family enzyme